MPDQTPEQREATLTYARFCMRPDVHPTFMELGLSRTALDLHTENVRLREALEAANGVLSHVGCCEESDMWKQHATSARTLIGRALSGSPATED